MPRLEPEHVGLAWLVREAIHAAPGIYRKLFPKKKTAAAARDPNMAIVEAEFRGEIHEFKRAMIEEAKVQRERYHALRTLTGTILGVLLERREARRRGEDFDTGVFEVNLKEMAARLDAMEDPPLPELSPPSSTTRPTTPDRPPRPPLASPRPDPDRESEPE